jgi:hypothetical protein
MTAQTAANKIRDYLVKEHGAIRDEVLVLTKHGVRSMAKFGWFTGDLTAAQVVCEGCYDWPMAVCEAIHAGTLDLGDFYGEPATGFALSLYRRAV